MYKNIHSKFGAISFNIIVILCVLLPFFFLPSTWSAIGAVKAVLLYVGVFLAASFWLVAQFVDGTLKIPNNKAISALGLWVLLIFVGSLVSKNVSVSLWGRGFSVDSFATVVVLALLSFLIASFGRDQRQLMKLFVATFTGSVITLLLQILLYISRNFVFISHYFSNVTTQGTLVGSWVDFAHFVIFVFLISLLMREVLAPKGFFKFLSLFAMILSIITLAFLNFKEAWVITIISALLVFVYKSSVERSILQLFSHSQPTEEVIVPTETNNHHFPYTSFVVLLIGLFFFLSSGSIGTALSHYAGVNFTDIRPSFSTSTHVMRAVLAKNPLFGAGAGRYSNVWDLYHPANINQTVFWNTSFDTSFSYLQSVVTTDGLLPVICLLAVIILSIIHGFKLFNYQFPDRFSRFIAVTSLIMLIAFLFLIALASPGIVLIAFGFIYLGLLFGVSTLVGKTKLKSINYLSDPRSSFFAILLLVLATMVGFSSVFFSGNRFASIIEYNRAITASDVGTAEARLNRAIDLSPNDVYWNTSTAFYTNQFTTAANVQNPDKTQLQNLFSEAEQSAQAAVSWDSSSASNWLSLSQVYQLVAGGTNGNADAYTNAKKAADQAQALNPNNPLFDLNQAQLALINQDAPGALNYIQKALELKPDYLDAYVLKAQIERAQGDNQAVVNEMNAYIQVAPYDGQGYLLLGQAELQLKDYQDALNAFYQAHQLSPTDPNSYLQYITTLVLMGNKNQAITELQAFKVDFPQINGVDDEIQRIESGAIVVPPSTTTNTTVSTTPKTTATASIATKKKKK